MSNKFHKYTSKDVLHFIKLANNSILLNHITLLINNSKNSIVNNINIRIKKDESNDEKNLFNSGFFSNKIIANFILAFLIIIKDGQEKRFNEVSLTPQMYKIFSNSILYLESLEYRVIKSKLLSLENEFKDEEEYKLKERDFYEKSYIIFENNKNFSGNILKGSMIIQNRPHNTLIIDFILAILMFLILYTLNHNSLLPYWSLFVQNTQMIGVWSNSAWLNRIDTFMKPRITMKFFSSFFTNSSNLHNDISQDFIDKITEKIVLNNIPIPENFASSLLEKLSFQLSESIHIFEFNMDINDKLNKKMSQKVFEEAITLSVNVCNSFANLSSLLMLELYNPKNKLLDKNSLIINYSKLVYGNSVSNNYINNQHMFSDANKIIEENAEINYDNELVYNYDYQNNRYHSTRYKQLLDDSSSGESSSHGSSYYSEDDSEVASQASYDESCHSEESNCECTTLKLLPTEDKCENEHKV